MSPGAEQTGRGLEATVPSASRQPRATRPEVVSEGATRKECF